jgi:hypothetical protein
MCAWRAGGKLGELPELGARGTICGLSGPLEPGLLSSAENTVGHHGEALRHVW